MLPTSKESGGGGDDEPLPPLRKRAPLEFALALFACVACTSAMMVKAWVLSARYDPGLNPAARPLRGLTPGWFLGKVAATPGGCQVGYMGTVLAVIYWKCFDAQQITW